MNQASATELLIQFDNRTIVAHPRPQDDDRLAGLMAAGRESLSIEPSDLDTEGHATLDEIAVDVEGHAITLRLPSPADAAALRRALAVAAVSATIVVAGAAASLQGTRETPAAPAQVTAPQERVDPAVLREQRLAERDPLWDTQISGTSEGVETGTSAGTHGPGRGELESNP